MSYKCDECGQSFKTLSAKRLHNCPGHPSTQHDFDDNLPPAREVLPETVIDLSKGRLTMEDSTALDDDPNLVRFFPILAFGDKDIMHRWDVVAGYVNAGDNHVLIGYNGDRGEWVVLDQNGDMPRFEPDKSQISFWLVDNNDVEPFDVVGYESGSPEYPEFGAT